MIYLLRIVLIITLIVLFVRTFARSLDHEPEGTKRQRKNDADESGRKVSDQTGEYVDYEEVD